MCYDVSVEDGDEVWDLGVMCKYGGVKWLSQRAL